MTVDITPASITVTVTVIGAFAKLVHWLVSREMDRAEKAVAEALEHRDERIKALELAVAAKDRELEGAFKAVKDTQRTLFEKLDNDRERFHKYQLDVAEKYVATNALKEMLGPLVTRLENIEHDLRNNGGVRS